MLKFLTGHFTGLVKTHRIEAAFERPSRAQLGNSSAALLLLQPDKTGDETLFDAQPHTEKKYLCLCEE